MIQDGMLLAVFNSAHRVMKAEYLLKGRGLAILLIPAPRALSTDCGLAIRYENELHTSILQVLAAEGVLPMIIYRKVSDSLYEEIWNGDATEEHPTSH
jgi:hypothetical protein